MNKNIIFSKYDLERNIKIPKISKDLAGFFGILSGDGYLSANDNVVGIALNLTEDVIYLKYIIKLIKKLFNFAPTVRFRQKEGKSDIIINSKAIHNFIKSHKFPIGKKKGKLQVPKWICKNKKFSRAFLKGLMDTDGSLFFAKRGTYKENQYPVIEIKCSDRSFIEQVAELLKNINFDYVLRSYKGEQKIQLNGKKKLKKWLKEIGIKNFNLISRYLIWKRLGFCPPKTNLRSRIEFLSCGDGRYKNAATAMRSIPLTSS